jgi:hypothetical protein
MRRGALLSALPEASAGSSPPGKYDLKSKNIPDIYFIFIEAKFCKNLVSFI